MEQAAWEDHRYLIVPARRLHRPVGDLIEWRLCRGGKSLSSYVTRRLLDRLDAYSFVGEYYVGGFMD